MKQPKTHPVDRRNFLKASATAFTGLAIYPALSNMPVLPAQGTNIIGPIPGYSPQIGTLVSMMNWMRSVVLQTVNGLSQSGLDFLIDEKANTIGAMLMHLAALDVFYQINTFENRKVLNAQENKRWNAALNLGDEARKTIKGHELQHYLTILAEVREKTLVEFKNRDDAWLATVDNNFWEQPTNNYCKWFHVCEHESNHNGQIKWILSRLPDKK